MNVLGKNFSLLIIDFFTFFTSLIIALLIRHFFNFDLEFIKIHLLPFSVIFSLWILVFYVFDLYDLRKISFLSDYSKNYLRAVVISLSLTILIFYALPLFSITPKTLLFIFIIIFLPLNLELRSFILDHFTKSSFKKVALVGENKDIDEVEDFLNKHQSLGIKKVDRFKNLGEIFEGEIYDFYVIGNEILRDNTWSNTLLKNILTGKTIFSSTTFIENFLYKIPVNYINEEWILNNLYNRDEFYEIIKRVIDFIVALIILCISLPLWPIIILGIKFSSKGPIFFKDKRVGKNENIFMLYKFRTMHEISYKNPKEKEIFGVKRGDERIFWWGKILRILHLDELPQLINVIKGDLSLVGPRPDSLVFYEFLKEKIPNYRLRTLVRPGVSGWAQVNGKTGDSVEEARERLEFDLYYLKNGNMILYLITIIKTIKVFLTLWGK